MTGCRTHEGFWDAFSLTLKRDSQNSLWKVLILFLLLVSSPHYRQFLVKWLSHLGNSLNFSFFSKFTRNLGSRQGGTFASQTSTRPQQNLSKPECSQTATKSTGRTISTWAIKKDRQKHHFLPIASHLGQIKIEKEVSSQLHEAILPSNASYRVIASNANPALIHKLIS